MATIKSFTDLSQSKVLAEFLPLESADMEYILEQWIDEKTYRPKEGYWEIPVVKVDDDDDFPLQPITHPCWSLTALLGVLPVMIDYKGSLIRLRMDKGNVGQDEYAIWYDDLDNGLSTNIASEAKDFIDACYEMIIVLHSENLL